MISDPATGTDPRWICALLQMGDTFYPTGAYSHSFGLEGMVEAGVVRNRATLEEFLHAAVIPGLTWVELPLVAHAHAAYAVPDWAQVAHLCELSSALRTAKEARLASDAIGRQRTELLARLRQAPLAVEHVNRAQADGWPYSSAVATALEARSLGAPVDWALGAAYYAGLAGTLAAAMKIVRLGQNAAQTLLTQALDSAPGVFAQARRVSVDEMGWFNPWLDIASARHEHAAARLFIS